MTKKHSIGVIGAGTMGAGIALTALFAGKRVILHDTFPEMLLKAEAYIIKFLEKKELGLRISDIDFVDDLAEMHSADIVIEAAPENLELKQQIFAELEKICSPKTIIATNTSTLSVSAIAAKSEFPGRMAGMHFFNPAPVLPLIEIVRSPKSAQETIDALTSLAKELGKTAVITTDTPGFIVNRVARPFYGEALRILGEGAATHEQIDRIVEGAAGFHMGPFRLMDLIGIDINAGAMLSLYEQTYGEPRYRPHPIQMRKVTEGDLGRKSGRGFYDYSDGNSPWFNEEAIKVGEAKGEIWLSKGSWAPELAGKIKAAGYEIAPVGKQVNPQAAFLQAGNEEAAFDELRKLTEFLPADVPLFVQTSNIALSDAIQHGLDSQLIGFDGLFLDGATITLQKHPALPKKIMAIAEKIMNSLGFHVQWSKESPALVLPRIIAQLVNEAAFAVQESVADADTIDLAMRLGVNYPLGPLEWGAKIGYAKVLNILDHLHSEFHEDRYRASSLLRRWARTEKI